MPNANGYNNEIGLIYSSAICLNRASRGNGAARAQQARAEYRPAGGAALGAAIDGRAANPGPHYPRRTGADTHFPDAVDRFHQEGVGVGAVRNQGELILYCDRAACGRRIRN
jgi:hypothetical protein